jgi:thiol-disulfide isomerase/thioredoxin
MASRTVRRLHGRGMHGALLITALALALTVAGQQRKPKSPGLSRGTAFPSLAIIDVSGDTVGIELAGDTQDKLIVFYSSSCPFCRQSLPIYRAVSQRCDLSLVIVLTDLRGPAMAAWWKDNRDGFSERCASMSIGSPLSSLSVYGLRGTPTHYLIDSNGQVETHFEGGLTKMPSWLIQ